MKNSIIYFTATLLAFFGSQTLAYSQHNHSDHEKITTEKKETVYQCPMKCEGDKTYVKAGDCPDCGMHLKEVKQENASSETFQCPMKCEGEKTYPKAANCPECGMALKQLKETTTKSDGDKKESKGASVYYTCSMHPDVKMEKEGNCPKCGMKLIEAEKTTK